MGGVGFDIVAKIGLDICVIDTIPSVGLRPLLSRGEAGVDVCATDALLIPAFNPLIFGFFGLIGVAYTDNCVIVGLDGCGDDVTASTRWSSSILDHGFFGAHSGMLPLPSSRLDVRFAFVEEGGLFFSTS